MENTKFSAEIVQIEKITFLYFICSVLVVYIHNNSIYYYLGNIDVDIFLSEYFSDQFTRFTIPLFLILSGALFYRNFQYNKIILKFKKRYKSLLIPYFFWNTISLMFVICITYMPFIRAYVSQRELFEPSVQNIFAGIFLNKYYGPFWFIKDLLIFTLFSPAIFSFLKIKLVGIGAILLLYVLSAFGMGLPESVFFSNQAVVCYLIGGYIGVHYGGLLSYKINDKLIIIGTIGFVAVSCVLMYDKYVGGILSRDVMFTVIILHCASIWLICNPSTGTIRSRWWLSCSFFIFATHEYVQPIISKFLYLIGPKNTFFAYQNFFISPLISVAIILYFASLMRKHVPTIWRISTGDR